MGSGKGKDEISLVFAKGPAMIKYRIDCMLLRLDLGSSNRMNCLTASV